LGVLGTFSAGALSASSLSAMCKSSSTSVLHGGLLVPRPGDSDQKQAKSESFEVTRISFEVAVATRPRTRFWAEAWRDFENARPRSGFPRSWLKLGHWEKGYPSVVESGARRGRIKAGGLRHWEILGAISASGYVRTRC
jgi:hypothetical protein